MFNITKTPIGTNGITLTEAKAWLKVDASDDDDLITALIIQARTMIEKYLNISLVETTITGVTDKTDFELPYGPLVDMYSVVTWSGRTALSYDRRDQRIILNEIPTDDYIEFVYKAGVDTLEGGIDLAWMTVIAYMYENRGDEEISKFIMSNPNLNLFRKKLWF